MSKILPFGLLLAILLSGFAIYQSAAQTADSPWTAPINLSHSGSTADPRMVMDAAGVIHIIWVDAYAGVMYSSGNVERWSSPHSVSFPFDPLYPQLFSDANGRIHAFGIDEFGLLSYSSVKAVDFDNLSQWLPVQTLAESVVSIDFTFDTQGILHFTYVRNNETVDSPAGVYYLRSTDNGETWSAPELLFESPYFRGLTVDQANLEITTSRSSASTNIFVAWDNRPRKQVLLTRSQDGGRSWEAPVQIAKPDANLEFTDPFHIQVGAFGDKLLLIWQDGDPVSSCNQYYQWSIDGGDTWGEHQQMIADINGCAQENRILSTSDDLFFLESTIQERVYLLAWNGNEWSTPQAQDVLISFTDPETYNSVLFSCRQQLVQEKPGNLFVVGCDPGTSENTGGSGQGAIGAGDIWFMGRALGTVNDWFPKAPAWSSPTIIATSEAVISSPILVVDNNERVHAFWKQPASDAVALNGVNPGQSDSIIYSRLDNENWSQPLPVTIFPLGEAQEPAFTLDSKDRLLAVWSTGESGVMNFSGVDAGKATSTSDWSNTEQVPIPFTVGNSPSIIADKSDTIYVTYAVPYNENRGIYLNKSTDNGKTWTKPMQIFDGAAADWEMVGNPRLTMTSEGYVHLLWTRSTIPTGPGIQGLYYVQSQDGGQTWSDVQKVVEKRAAWSDLLGTFEGTIHRVWQEDNNGWGPIWDQYSLDNGATWSQATSISGIGESLGLAVLKVDSGGQFHLMQIASRSDGIIELQHWVWVNKSWLKDEGLEIGLNTVLKVNTLEAAISPSGIMSVLYTGSINNQRSDQLQYNLFYTVHVIDLLSVSPIPAEGETPVSVETQLPTEAQSLTPKPELNITPTYTPALTGTNGISANSTPLPNSWTGVMLGAGIAVIIIGLVLGITIWKLRALRR